MGKIRKEIITLDISALKNGETFIHRLEDSDFNNVTFRFSVQKDKNQPSAIRISSDDDENVEITVFNAEDNKGIRSSAMNITTDDHEPQLLVEIAISKTDENGNRAWKIRFSKEIEERSSL